ncbi:MULTISPECIES: sigma-70 family RNA polymerase sigma factor [unclassified Streptomyces]|uniref:sigma-70 family RNA polymerase sigma factor n=1 Tax=unclassified Streptomyces TaxID=2593676 RepID=UPI002E75CD3F|nr:MULTISPECIES: sigma-70 family RNA polymerase sigma factor [unclassified Streptomyces]MEE1761898.1 sigma-70 family RNA polymerase sigma factor [Streptomyces sp. SP18BB07]MEE1835394.1 sigma-70 family RNA polymerase sigma factor [Streptomyces sp. SP17KL33]
MSDSEDREFLARRFESHRPRLRAVAYRMLGSLAEADDAVQEAWLKLSRVDADEVRNLGGWLTTVVGRVCLDMLRTRRSRGEEPLSAGPYGADGVGGADGAGGVGGGGLRMPEPVISPLSGVDPEQEVLLADSVGLALLVVLETLGPAERLAFVLHDLFGVPFDDIGPLVGRTPTAARQLASRARRRVRGGAPVPDANVERQREVVDAFLRAAREGDVEGLVAVLAPDAVARSADGVTRGAVAVASQAAAYSRLGAGAGVRQALVNGAVGVVVVRDGRVERVLSFAVVEGRIAAIDVVSEEERVASLDVAVLGG